MTPAMMVTALNHSLSDLDETALTQELINRKFRSFFLLYVKIHFSTTLYPPSIQSPMASLSLGHFRDARLFDNDPLPIWKLCCQNLQHYLARTNVEDVLNLARQLHSE